MAFRLKVFKHAEDRLPVACILALSALDFILYFTVSNPYVLGCYFFAMIIPKSQICAWNHHHQHAPTFLQSSLNRLLEFFYALHTGVTTNLWVLHHNYGHHQHYLDQSKDQSRWQRKDGSTMGELEYSLNVAATSYWRGYQVGKDFPAERHTFVLFSAITFLMLAFLIWYKPIPAIFLFVLPMPMGLFMTAWATLEHHSGLSTDNPYEASFNNLNKWYNFFTGNLGYHTAHHHNGGLHWSKLPRLHERLADKIPDRLIRRTWV